MTANSWMDRIYPGFRKAGISFHILRPGKTLQSIRMKFVGGRVHVLIKAMTMLLIIEWMCRDFLECFVCELLRRAQLPIMRAVVLIPVYFLRSNSSPGSLHIQASMILKSVISGPSTKYFNPARNGPWLVKLRLVPAPPPPSGLLVPLFTCYHGGFGKKQCNKARLSHSNTHVTFPGFSSR